jgi:hypothetical protein
MKANKLQTLRRPAAGVQRSIIGKRRSPCCSNGLWGYMPAALACAAGGRSASLATRVPRTLSKL